MGIIDSHGLAFSLLRDIEDNGGICALASSVTRIEFDSKYSVTFVDGNNVIPYLEFTIEFQSNQLIYQKEDSKRQ